MNKYAQALAIIDRVRAEQDVAVLEYSAGGKDSIALLDMLANKFKRVICYYMYLVPELDHIRPYITWAETHFGKGKVEVRQVPHFQRDIWLKYGFFREPDPEAPKPRNIGQVEEEFRTETGLHYIFSGMKGVDGYMKRMRLKMYGKTGWITKHGTAYPLANWTNAEVLKYIDMRHLIKPFVYTEGTVSQGYGITLDVLLLLKYRYPADYRRTLAEFPLAEKLLFDFCDGFIPKGQEKAVAGVLKRLDMEYLMPTEIKTADVVTAPEADDIPEEETE